MGHSCGLDFHAKVHLQEHPEFGWQKDILQDLDSHAMDAIRNRPVIKRCQTTINLRLLGSPSAAKNNEP